MKTTPVNRADDVGVPTRRSLLSRLRNLDDSTSWKDFFETYWKLIYRAAVHAGLSDAEAQDVVQETVLTVVRKIPEFQYRSEAGSFRGWLLHTTRWRVLDQMRKRAPGAGSSGDPEGGDHRLAQLPDPAGERLEALWEAEWQQNLMDAAIQRIKRQVRPKHYQLFELHVLKGWPAGKVAATLGVNVAQVHLVKHRVGNLIKREVKRLAARGV